MHHRSIAVLFAVLVSAGVALAADHEMRQISVLGTATVDVAPDQMRWRVSVRTTDAESARRAADLQGKAVAQVIALIKRNGVAERDLQTSRLRLGEHWTHEGPKRTQAGYMATTDLVFTLADLARYTDLWLSLADVPAVSIDGIELDHSERIRLQDEARDLAAQAARAKAARLAETLGVKLGKVLVVEEDLLEEVGRFGMPMFSNMVRAGAGPGQGDEVFAPGTIPVRARLKVVFALEDRS